MAYANAAHNFQVIADDQRNPYVSWRHHLERGSSGGVDIVAGYGTPLYAPCDGVVQNVPWYGSGGNTVRIFHGNGNYDEYMHMSRFDVPNGTRVRMGQQVGLSGASGWGEWWYYGQHWHWHLYVSGRRVNPWDYFDTPWPGSSSAGGDTKPLPKPITKEAIVAEILYKGSTPTVFWQSEPNSPLVPIDQATFNGQRKAGLELVEISDADIHALRIRFGTLQRPVGGTATGLAYRNEEDGSIYWQREPGTELRPISMVEWRTLQQNGLLYVDYPAAAINELLATGKS